MDRTGHFQSHSPFPWVFFRSVYTTLYLKFAKILQRLRIISLCLSGSRKACLSERLKIAQHFAIKENFENH